MDEYQKRLIDSATAEKIRGKILDDRSQNTSAYDPDGIETPETLVPSTLPGFIAYHVCRTGTSHISTADHSGMAVSLTTTINTFFGNKVIVPETGVIMNNEMDGMFSNLSSPHR